MTEAFLIVWAVSVTVVLAAVVQEVVRCRRTRNRNRNLRQVAEIARKFGLTVTSGYRTSEEQRERSYHWRRSAIWPEVSEHYDHDHSGLWQRDMKVRQFDPEMAQRQIEFYRQYILSRYLPGPPDPQPITCVHQTPAGIECPWCES